MWGGLFTVLFFALLGDLLALAVSRRACCSGGGRRCDVLDRLATARLSADPAERFLFLLLAVFGFSSAFACVNPFIHLLSASILLALRLFVALRVRFLSPLLGPRALAPFAACARDGTLAAFAGQGVAVGAALLLPLGPTRWWLPAAAGAAVAAAPWLVGALRRCVCGPRTANSAL